MLLDIGNVAVSLSDVFIILLAILGIVAIAYLIVVLKNLSTTLDSVRKLVEKNEDSLDETMKSLPGLTSKVDLTLLNLNDTLDQANVLLRDLAPDIKDTMTGVKTTMNSVNKITDDVSGTVDFISRSAIDSVDSFTSGFSKNANVLSSIMDGIETVKNIVKKK